MDNDTWQGTADPDASPVYLDAERITPTEPLRSDHAPYPSTRIADLHLDTATRVQPCTYFYADQEPIHFLRIWLDGRAYIHVTLGGGDEDKYNALTELLLGAQAARQRIGQYAGARAKVDEAVPA